MISAITSLGIFATFAAAAATPAKPLPTEVVNRMNAKLGTAHGGALDLPVPTTPPSLKDAAYVPGPDQFTVEMIVLHDTDIVSVHVESYDSPDPVGGKVNPGTINNRGNVEFVVPRDYSGNIAFNIAGFPADTGDESLIELSFKNQNGLYTPDIDVSFVNGFSVPITCSCSQNKDEAHFSGCSKDLYDLNPCPNDNGQHACKNPRRFDEANKSPTPFFAPCHRYGGAYTYPDDNLANTLNGDRCRKYGVALCCIGKECTGWDDLPRK